jgi:plasmid maintenance system killer protein
LKEVYDWTSFHFEKYKEGKYKGKHSIRCDKQFRLIIDIETDPELILILEEVTDPH